MQQQYRCSIQDRFLPIANVGRVMKNALPSSGRVSVLIDKGVLGVIAV